MAKKKKLPISVFEIVWYTICLAVALWGLTYVVLGIVTKYNNIEALTNFNEKFANTFGLQLYFWGLIIVAIAAVATVIVLLFFAKTFDRATEREQRRSARLSALKQEEKVVDEQSAQVVDATPAE